MDSQNERRAGVEDNETNLAAVTVFAGDAGDGRKRSPKVHRKPRQIELRCPICVDRSSGSRNGPYF
jgi:hypothetical protein